MSIEFIQKQYNNEGTHDVKIIIKDKTIFCHKFMLESHSPMINGMFKSNMSESNKREIKFDSFEYDVVDHVISSFYFIKKDYSDVDFVKFLEFYDYVGLCPVKLFLEISFDKFPKNYNIKNVITFFEIRGKEENNMDGIYSRIAQLQCEFIKRDVNYRNNTIMELEVNKCNLLCKFVETPYIITYICLSYLQNNHINLINYLNKNVKIIKEHIKNNYKFFIERMDENSFLYKLFVYQKNLID